MTTLDNLMQNPYIWLILSICTIVSLIFAIYTWHISKKKQISCCKDFDRVVLTNSKYKLPKSHLKYKNIEIQSLTVTKYAIWNSSKTTLYWSDIAQLQPLQIIVNSKDINIFDAKIVKQSEPANGFQILESSNEYVKIKFDYMDKLDGMVLQIIHDGDATLFDVACKIKGGKKSKKSRHFLLKKQLKL